MDFKMIAKKLVSSINEDDGLKELTVYTAMFLLNTTKYEKIMPVLEYLERKNILVKDGKKWRIVGRE